MKTLLVTVMLAAPILSFADAIASTASTETGVVDCDKYADHVADLARKDLEARRPDEPRNASALKSLRQMQMKSCSEGTLPAKSLACAMTAGSLGGLRRCGK